MIAAAVHPGRQEGWVSQSDDRLLAFDEVYRRYADAVYRFCLSQLGDASLAEDIAADTFASAFAAYDRVRPEPGGLRPWLFRIARNAALDQHRRHGRVRGFLARLAGHGPSPVTVEERAEV